MRAAAAPNDDYDDDDSANVKDEEPDAAGDIMGPQKPDNMTEEEWRHAQQVAYQKAQYDAWQKQEYERWEKHRFFQFQLQKFQQSQKQNEMRLWEAQQVFLKNADAQMKQEAVEHHNWLMKMLYSPDKETNEEIVDKIEEEAEEL